MSSKLTIEVYGTRYPITTTEDPQYVQDIVREMNETIGGLMRGSGISLNQALVLMALHYLDSLRKSGESADHLREQVSEYMKDASDARAELAALQQQFGQQLKFENKHAKKR